MSSILFSMSPVEYVLIFLNFFPLSNLVEIVFLRLLLYLQPHPAEKSYNFLN